MANSGITSPSGLLWLIQCSRPTSGERLIDVLQAAPAIAESMVAEVSSADG